MQRLLGAKYRSLKEVRTDCAGSGGQRRWPVRHTQLRCRVQPGGAVCAGHEQVRADTLARPRSCLHASHPLQNDPNLA